MGLAIFNGELPPKSFVSSAKHIEKVSEDKLQEVFNWVVEVLNDPFEFSSIEDLAKSLGVDKNAAVGVAVFMRYLYNNLKLSDEELASDLKTLNISDARATKLLSILSVARSKYRDQLVSNRDEAIPELKEINWRVDIRTASNDYLPEPELVVLMRLLCYDGDDDTHIYLEMDKQRFLILDRAVEKIKIKLAESEALIGKMQQKASP